MGGLEEMHTSFWWKDLKGGGPDAGIDGRIILEWLLKKWNGRLSVGL